MEWSSILSSVITVILILAPVTDGRNISETDLCTETSIGKITWDECRDEWDTFFRGDVASVFAGTNAMIWPAVETETLLQDKCTIYKATYDTDYMKRSDISPVSQQYLAKGFHEMIDYLLCGDGQKEYLRAKDCLDGFSFRLELDSCFKPYFDFTRYQTYDAIKDSDDLAHKHCDVFKKYQQCRVDTFMTHCGEELSKWNNEAIVKYYDKYMDNIYCDINGGLTTAVIIFIVLGSMGGLIVLFCACFCCSRFMNCTSGNEEHVKSYFKNLSKLTNKQPKSKTEQKLKDAEAANKKETQQNGYYNTKELDNNSANEVKEERRNNRELERIDETRDRRFRDDPGYYSRDSPMASPGRSPMGSPRGLPRVTHSPRRQRSYGEMFRSRMPNGGHLPPNYGDMQRPRGLRRY